MPKPNQTTNTVLKIKRAKLLHICCLQRSHIYSGDGGWIWLLSLFRGFLCGCFFFLHLPCMQMSQDILHLPPGSVFQVATKKTLVEDNQFTDNHCLSLPSHRLSQSNNYHCHSLPTGSQTLGQKNNVKVIETTFLVLSFKKRKCKKFFLLLLFFFFFNMNVPEGFSFNSMQGYCRVIWVNSHSKKHLCSHLCQDFSRSDVTTSVTLISRATKPQDVSLPFTSSLSSTSVDIDKKTLNGLFLFFPPDSVS